MNYIKYQIIPTKPGLCKARGKCVVTNREYETAEFTKADYEAWRGAAKIQDAMPYLSLGDREFLMTQISPEGWRRAFPARDEE